MRWQWWEWAQIDRDLLYAVLRLRQEVFVVEQACIYLDADGRDPSALHLTGIDEHGIVAYLRAFGPDPGGAARIGRVIVAPRGQEWGLGRAVMAEGMRGVAEQFGDPAVCVAAQAHLERFYASLGFVVEGPVYDEDGIPHVDMRFRRG